MYRALVAFIFTAAAGADAVVENFRHKHFAAFFLRAADPMDDPNSSRSKRRKIAHSSPNNEVAYDRQQQQAAYIKIESELPGHEAPGQYQQHNEPGAADPAPPAAAAGVPNQQAADGTPPAAAAVDHHSELPLSSPNSVPAALPGTSAGAAAGAADTAGVHVDADPSAARLPATPAAAEPAAQPLPAAAAAAAAAQETPSLTLGDIQACSAGSSTDLVPFNEACRRVFGDSRHPHDVQISELLPHMEQQLQIIQQRVHGDSAAGVPASLTYGSGSNYMHGIYKVLSLQRVQQALPSPQQQQQLKRLVQLSATGRRDLGRLQRNRKRSAAAAADIGDDISDDEATDDNTLPSAAAAAAPAPAAAAAAAAPAAAAAAGGGLTLGTINNLHPYLDPGNLTPFRSICNQIYCDSRHWTSVQLSALLPHLGEQLQSIQQRAQANGRAGAVLPLSVSAASNYVNGINKVLLLPEVQQDMATAEQQQALRTLQQQAAAAREVVLQLCAQHRASKKHRATAAAPSAAAAAAGAAAAASGAVPTAALTLADLEATLKRTGHLSKKVAGSHWLFSAWAKAAYGSDCNTQQVQLQQLVRHPDALEAMLQERISSGALSWGSLCTYGSNINCILRVPEVAAVLGEQLLSEVQEQGKALRQRLKLAAAAAEAAGEQTAAEEEAVGPSDGAGALQLAPTLSLPPPAAVQDAADAAQAPATAAAAAPAASAGGVGALGAPAYSAAPSTAVAAPAAAAGGNGPLGTPAHSAEGTGDVPAAAAAAAGAPVASAAAAAVAAAAAAATSAGGGPMTFAAAERLLLKLYTALLQPDRDQLLRFKRAMRRLDSIKQEGDAKLDRFWSDYEWVVVVASTAGMEYQDWVDALNTLVDNALAD